MDRSNTTLEDRLDQLEEKIKVDETNISAELISHPHDFYHVARGAADAVSLRDMAKFNVETYESELYLSLRKELLESGNKFTEALLEHLVHRDPDRIKLVEKYLNSKHLSDRWSALKESFIQKGYMLKEIVDNRKSDNIAEGSYSSQRREALSSFQR
jgi:hypothetical protein